MFSRYFHEKIVSFSFIFDVAMYNLYFFTLIHSISAIAPEQLRKKQLFHSFSAIAPENVRKNDSNSAKTSLQIKLKQSSQANSDKIGLRNNVMLC